MDKDDVHKEVSASEKSAVAKSAQTAPRSCRGTGVEMKNEAGARYNDHFHHLRFVVLVASGMAMGMMLVLRLSITVAMVSMVNHTQLFVNEHPNATDEDVKEYFDPGYREVGEFNWSNEVQEKIITFYMITYTVFQFFATRLIMKYGLRIGVSLSLATCAMTNILTPIIAYWGWQWIMLLRLINGAAASGVAPGMVNLIGSWTPKRETANGVVIYQFTGNLLAVFSPLIGGFLASVHWKWAYYVPGVVVLIFCMLWWIIVPDSPEESKLISQRELDLINERANNEAGSGPTVDSGQVVAPDQQEKTSAAADCGSDKSTRLTVPYYKMFSVAEFYYMAILWILYCATSGGFIFLLPAYLHRVLKVPVDKIGMLTFISQLGSLFSMLWPNQVADFLIDKFKLSLTAARRVVVFICVLMAGVSLLYLAYSHSYLVVMVCIHRFFHMTHDTIFLATVMSQFGKFGLSGLVYSMLNSLGCVNSTIFCVLVGKFLDYTGETLECWSWVFITITLMNVLYFVIYSLFCHSNPVKIKVPTSSSSFEEDGEK